VAISSFEKIWQSDNAAQFWHGTEKDGFNGSRDLTVMLGKN
jgi:hypothetical protein